MRSTRLAIAGLAAVIGLSLVACSPEDTGSGDATGSDATDSGTTDSGSGAAEAGSDLDVAAYDDVIA
ncbi:MAG TPA: hypothetical protein DHV14_14515, partial [Micrococcales bacterium]|nr:hypothetical protein [Micrococcales bacterium]